MSITPLSFPSFPSQPLAMPDITREVKAEIETAFQTLFTRTQHATRSEALSHPEPITSPKRSDSFATSSLPYQEIIEEMSEKYEVPVALIRSVIGAESSFHPDAVSRSGAAGLMQLMPETARELGVTDRFDPRENIEGGTKYLRQMLDRFGGSLEKALAAYNAGPSHVERYDGVPPFTETVHYVEKVLGSFRNK